jgi:hypothetical protein
MFHPILKEVEKKLTVISLNNHNYEYSIVQKFNIPKNKSFDLF